MALHDQLPIYVAAMQLTCIASRLVAHMPRNHRAVDGARLVRSSRELLTHIRRANAAADKAPHIDRIIDRATDTGEELIVCKELRLISMPGFAQAAALAVSIEKQAGGWKKYSASKPVSRSSR